MLRSRTLLLLAILVGGALVGTPAQAQADFKVRATTDSGVVEANDSATPGDIILMIGDTQQVTIHATTLVSSGFSKLDLDVEGMDNFTTTSLVIQASWTGITTTPAPYLTYAFTGTGVDPTDPIVKFQTWIGSDNTLFGTHDLVDTGSQDLGSTGTKSFSSAGAYSMTAEIRVSNITSGDFLILGLDSNNITPTPAPAGFVLALTSLPLLGLGAWHRRRRAPLPI